MQWYWCALLSLNTHSVTACCTWNTRTGGRVRVLTGLSDLELVMLLELLLRLYSVSLAVTWPESGSCGCMREAPLPSCWIVCRRTCKKGGGKSLCYYYAKRFNKHTFRGTLWSCIRLFCIVSITKLSKLASVCVGSLRSTGFHFVVSTWDIFFCAKIVSHVLSALF